MGIFTPDKTMTIKGTIDRIGVIRVSDLSLDYGFTLVGDPTRYVARAYPLRAEWDLALAQPGDQVSFTVSEKDPHNVWPNFTVKRPENT